MRRLGLCAALWILAGASYASAAVPEGVLGAPLPKADGGQSTSGRAPTVRIAPRPGSAVRYAKALGGLEAQGRPATRGAAEVRIYQAASPAVVLVVTDDALGSGALISADGKIITNLHVVGDARDVGVVFKPKTEGGEVSEADVRKARVIRRDEVADLALLQVSQVPAGVTPLLVGASTAVQVGADVHAIGHPTGETWTYTRGIVSQIRKDYEWSAEDHLPHKATVIQTQTPINPGNSGGPLLDDALEIVGINSFKSDGEGLNFAVSGEDVKAFLARKSDRKVAPAAKKALAAKSCEATEVDSWPSKKPAGTFHSIDDDCDGKANFVMLEPDDRKLGFMFIFDDDDDGNADAMVFDDDRDGHPDYALYDTDHNGKPDMKGEFKPGEDEPFRYERIKE